MKSAAKWADVVLDANLAELRRVKHAANALIVLLRHDQRVQQAREEWRNGATQPGGLPLIIDRAQRLVEGDLGLPYRWLPQLLVRDWIYQPFGGIELDPEEPSDFVPGKEKGGAAIVARDVAWFYRAEIKKPSESERSLAAEYLATLEGPRAGDGRSTIQAGIAKAKQLLAGLTLADLPLPK